MEGSRLVRMLGLVACCFAFPIAASASPMLVTVDTSGIAGTDADIAFDLIDGGTPANTITLSNFTTDGTMGASSATGDVTGSLPGAVTIGDTSFFNEYLQNVTLGTTFSFVLESTNLPEDPGSFPDGFSLFVLDHASGLPIGTTTDPTGAGALMLWTLGTTSPELYASDTMRIGIGAVPPTNGVPEPSTLPLALVGLLAIIGLSTLGVWRVRAHRNSYGA